MQNYVYIYFKRLPEGYWLDDIEEDLEAILGDVGELTGSGFGESGGNIDIEFFNDMDEVVLQEIKQYLLGCGFDEDTVWDINGERVKLFTSV